MSSNKVLANQEPNKFLISQIKVCRNAIKRHQRDLDFINNELAFLDLIIQTSPSLRGDFKRQINARSGRMSYIRIKISIIEGLSNLKNILKDLKDQLLT